MRALLIDNDADDLDSFRKIEKLQHLVSESAICGTAVGETKLTASMWVKPAVDELAQIIGLYLGGNVHGQRLPGVARALDDLDHIRPLVLTESCHPVAASSPARWMNLENFAGDDHALNFAGAFANGAQLDVAIILLRRDSL